MMKNDEENKDDAKTWGTWEELLLACAVKRHGIKNWESVAVELQTKTSLPHLLTTAQCCKQKYHDLKRRFKDEQQEHEHEHEHEPPPKFVNIPWLEELRKVRVDELKQEVQRYDHNIHSLKLKVKRLEEEREPPPDNKTIQQKPDLDDRNIIKKDEPEKVCKRLVSGEESDRDNRSVNESNSTGLSEKIGDGEIIKNESKVVGSGGMGGSKAVESDELGDSVTQLSSDVQSSSSFGEKRKRSCGDSIKGTDVKSEPLIRLLELIRTHKHVSLFERRLNSQESIKYKEMVRQHVDLETIQTRVERGSYSSCILAFYRDVLLLFNNAIVYFPNSSVESSTAFQLRNLFSNEIKKDNLKSDSSQDPPPPPPASLPPRLKPHLERSDSLLAKHKQSSPIIFCRKRTSVSTKPSTSSTFVRQQQTDDKKPPADVKPSVERRSSSSSSLLKVKTEEKAVTTGARSSRRSNRIPTTNTDNTSATPSNKKENATSGSKAGSGSGSVDKQGTPKADKKKSERSTASDKKKSVVDFLKRIKKNSPVQAVKRSKGSEEPKKDNNNNSSGSGKKEKGKERALWKSGEKKQAAKEENSPSKRNVGRPPKMTPETSGKRRRESGGKGTVVGQRQSKRARR